MNPLIKRICETFSHEFKEWKDETRKQKMYTDMEYLLRYAEKPSSVFAHYITWQKTLLHLVDIDYVWFEKMLETTLTIGQDELSDQAKTNIKQALDADLTINVDDNQVQNIEAICDFHTTLFQDLDKISSKNHRDKMIMDGNYVLKYLHLSTEKQAPSYFDDFLAWHINLMEVIGLERISLIRFLVSIHIFVNPEHQKIIASSTKSLIQKNLTSNWANQSYQTSDLAQKLTEISIHLFGDYDPHSQKEQEDKILFDAIKTVDFLEQSVQTESELLFTEYISWLQSTLTSLGISTLTIIRFLTSLRILIKNSPLAKGVNTLDVSIRQLVMAQSSDEGAEKSFIKCDEAQHYLDLLLNADRKGATQYIMDLAENKMSVKDIYLDIFQASQYQIGLLWEQNKVSVAQEHYCTATTQLIMSMLYSKIFSTQSIGKSVVATCVGSELHELGIRMVSDFLEMEGWDSYYIGANTPTVAIMDAIETHQADLLAVSVTLTPHIPKATEIISTIREHYPNVKVLVGGYPFLQDPDLWKKMGADGLAKSAQSAHEVALSLVS